VILQYWKTIMLSLIHAFRQNESGATATEYAMLIVFIALGIAAAAQTLGGGITNLFDRVSNTLTNVSMPTV
jgi:pilus assembly protein Flp/PilA